MVVFEGGSVRSVQTKGKEVQMLGEGDAVSRVVVGERFVAIVAKGKVSVKQNKQIYWERKKYI